MTQVKYVDSHTAGEPTRVVVSGAPDLGDGPMSERLKRFRDEHDRFRSAVVNEPRGSDVLVGALLCEPHDRSCVAGTIFFNNVGYLGGCGHGTIGLVATLRHLGRIDVGSHRIETPVGVVTATLAADGSVALENVPSWRQAKGVRVDVPGIGPVVGDVAWGGNWFFLVDTPSLSIDVDHVEMLTERAWAIRRAVNEQGYPDVDHVELFGPPGAADADSRNFVLCPGKAYDRSPCGTGTSAKLACLAADGKLAPETSWVQESVVGTRFVGSYRRLEGPDARISPTILGRAWVNAEGTMIFAQDDPFAWGIRGR